MNFSYLVESAASTDSIPEGLDMNNFKDFFDEYKKKKLERPDLMIKQGLAALKRGSSCGVDLNLVHEALFNAAVEVGDVALAKTHVSYLEKKFPESVRVGILSGRFLELSGEYEKALTKYNILQEKDLSNIAIMKRKVCCYRCMRNTRNAVDTLHEILKTYSADSSCWFQLYELYVHCGDYESASYCCEEIVMIDGSIASNHNRLADVYYTLGSSSSSSSNSSQDDIGTTSGDDSISNGNWAGPNSALQKGNGNLNNLDYLLLSRKHYTLA